jgi:hypothetical protein
VLMSMPASDHFADAALGAKGLTTAPLCALTPAPLTRRRRRMGAKEPPRSSASVGRALRLATRIRS